MNVNFNLILNFPHLFIFGLTKRFCFRASPVKDSSLDDDLLEGVVEKRPKFHKHLPLNYQVTFMNTYKKL